MSDSVKKKELKKPSLTDNRKSKYFCFALFYMVLIRCNNRLTCGDFFLSQAPHLQRKHTKLYRPLQISIQRIMKKKNNKEENTI